MKVAIDTNVILDVLLNRSPWVAEAQQVWDANRAGHIEGHLVATTITNVFYIARRIVGVQAARIAVGQLLASYVVLPVDQQRLREADALSGADLEDNLIVTCAAAAGVSGIVTRDAGGFARSPIPVWTPAQLLTQISAGP